MSEIKIESPKKTKSFSNNNDHKTPPSFKITVKPAENKHKVDANGNVVEKSLNVNQNTSSQLVEISLNGDYMKHISNNNDIPNPNTIIYKLAYARLKKIASGQKITATSITILVASAMQIVQDTKRNGIDPLTGEEKKAIVTKMIHQWVDESEGLTLEDKQYLNYVFIPTMLGGIIDSFCSLNINGITKKSLNKCFVFCCGKDAVENTVEPNTK